MYWAILALNKTFWSITVHGVFVIFFYFEFWLNNIRISKTHTNIITIINIIVVLVNLFFTVLDEPGNIINTYINLINIITVKMLSNINLPLFSPISIYRSCILF